ncbi:hypothetical protein [Klebsiella variicola]|uniref:hypothetical protein n=1 Tax=Klebsiella variicola TaxID=244366 RepID=UPI00388D29A1
MILRGLRDTFRRTTRSASPRTRSSRRPELSDRYITARFLPDKAIDLLDQAAARVKLSATARPVAVQELESELHQLRREQDYVAARKQYDQAAELGKRIEAKEAELRSSSRTGSGSGPPAVPRSGGTRGADRLAPDRHPGQRVDGGRARKAAALGTTAAAPGGTRRGGPCRGRCRAAVPRRPA